LNSESRTLKSPSLTGIMFLPAILNTPAQTIQVGKKQTKNDVS
jgi:hypothetical protein